MECGYYDAGVCRSCTWLPRPYDEQVAAKQARTRSLLADHHDLEWLPPVTGAEAAFRNKAKMVVAGTVDAPTLGILDAAGHGTDLRGCGLHEPVLHDALPAFAELVTRARLTPYDVPARTGELKHVVVTASPDGELMARFVLRSTEALPRLRKHLPWLRERLPHLRVVSADLQPRHAAVLDGEQVEVLLGSTLPVRVNGFTLHLRPSGFFQTSTAVAAALYREAAAWAQDGAVARARGTCTAASAASPCTSPPAAARSRASRWRPRPCTRPAPAPPRPACRPGSRRPTPPPGRRAATTSRTWSW